jgi:hypothetical protein
MTLTDGLFLNCAQQVARRYPDIDESRLVHEAIRRLIDRMVRDLVAETGRRLADGNFLWSGHVSLLVLFVASARWLFAEAAAGGVRSKPRLAVCAVVLLLHVVAGWQNALRFIAKGDHYFL